jgi:hypothetical protein
MKYIKKMTLIFAIVSGLHINTTAQQYTSLQYTVAVPVNDLEDYISKISFRGFTFEHQASVNSDIAVGVSVGYNLFYEKKPYDTYYDGTASLSGIQYRYTSSVPVHLSGVYFFQEENRLIPFAGLGIGTTYTLRDTDMGLYRWEEDGWSFSLRPEAGFIYQLKETIGVKAAARYNAAFKTSELKDQSYFSFSLGLVFIN